MSQTLASDDAAVAALGYKQKLDRSLSHFSLWALQFSYISAVASAFLLFGFGYGLVGPSLLWPWAAFWAGQMLVSLMFCELASHYPVAGSVYNWSKQLAAGWSSWMAGWMVVVLGPITLVAIVLVTEAIMPAISSVFQVIGSTSNPRDVAENTVLLGGCLVVLCTIFNCLRVRFVGRANNLTVVAEVAVALFVIVLLFAHARRGPGVVFNTLGTHKYLSAFLIAALFGGYQFYGMDTASSLGEETADPHRRAPKSIINAMIGSFVIGALMIIATSVAIPKLTDPNVPTGGLSYVVDTVLGTGVGRVLLIGALIAVFGAGLAVQAAGVRIIFGMSRDQQLPFSRHAARVTVTSKAMVWPTIVIGLVALAMLGLNVASTQIVAILSSAAVATASLAYLFVTVPLLQARLRGTWPPPKGDGRQHFSLGRLGLPVNILAIMFGVAATVNLLWPRKSVFNPTPPFHWYFQYGPLLYIVLVVGGGSLYYLRVAKARQGALTDHSRTETGVRADTEVRAETEVQHSGETKLTT